ncbi:MAG TPA: MMPL family transporter, partial [Acidimicrobiales bacterium]|nr:MMPL family transporter [Acidimicrobiales bacterium]
MASTTLSTARPSAGKPDKATGPRNSSKTPWTGRLAQWVLGHRRVVMVAWLLVFAAGGAGASHLTGRLQVNFALPGQPGYVTAQKIIGLWGNGGDTNPTIPVVTVPAGQTVQADAPAIARAFSELAARVPDVRVVDLANTGDSAFVTAHGTSTFALMLTPYPKGFGGAVDPKKVAADLEAALPGYKIGTTGLDQLESGGSTKGPGVLLETLLGGLGALAVLAFVFASLLALLPLLIAAVAIVSTLLVILGLTYVTDVSFIVQFLVSLIGLGVAIDYSLLLVTRWREQRDKGASNEQAIVLAASTAGRAVALSGLTVAIGLLSLVVIPMPSMRSVGIGGMLIPVVSVAVVLTLLPALLGGVGTRMDWPHRRHETTASRLWSKWAAVVVRRRVIGLATAVVILVLLVIPIFGIKVGTNSLASLAPTGSAHDELTALVSDGVPAGVLTPIEVLTRSQDAVVIAHRLSAVPGISTVAVASGSTGTRGGFTDVIAVPSTPSLNNTTLQVVNAARTAVENEPGYVGMSGAGPGLEDFSHAVYGRFPLMFGVVALLTMLLLTLA